MAEMNANSRTESKRRWTPAEDALLGTMPDPEVAQALQRTALGVRKRRRLLGVPPFADPAMRPWPAEEEKLLGTMPDAQLAHRLGRSTTAVKQRRKKRGIPIFGGRTSRREAEEDEPWMPAEDGLLGRMADETLASRLHRTVGEVSARRRELGLGDYNPQRPLWRPEDDRVLGTRPDDQIALLLGMSVKAVVRRREELGIRPAPTNDPSPSQQLW
jgi:hypothetical protein